MRRDLGLTLGLEQSRLIWGLETHDPYHCLGMVPCRTLEISFRVRLKYERSFCDGVIYDYRLILLET